MFDGHELTSVTGTKQQRENITYTLACAIATFYLRYISVEQPVRVVLGIESHPDNRRVGLDAQRHAEAL